MPSNAKSIWSLFAHFGQFKLSVEIGIYLNTGFAPKHEISNRKPPGTP